MFVLVSAFHVRSFPKIFGEPCQGYSHLKVKHRESPGVYCLELHAFTAGGLGSIPRQRTKVPQTAWYRLLPPPTPQKRVKHRKTNWEAPWKRVGLADSVGHTFWAVSLGTTTSKYQWILARE